MIDSLNDQIDLIKIVVAIILAVLGWLIVHYFNNKRNFITKKREITIKHLINSYRILTNEISHRENSIEKERKLENILSDIQLFGTPEQVDMAKDLANTVASKEFYELDKLINSLRDDLRKKLGLAKINGNVTWLRYNK